MTSVPEYPMLYEAANKLIIIADRATPGPYSRSRTVPGAVRCQDAADGSERHIGYGIDTADARLIAGADPEATRRLARVFAEAAADDAATPALIALAVYLSGVMGLKLAIADAPSI